MDQAMDEASLVKLCQDGHLENFARLYDHYLPKIYGYIYYRTKHKETAEDLTSIIFEKAIGQIKSYNSGKGSFSAWLYTVARNALIDNKRSERITLDIDDIELPDATDHEEKINRAFRINKVKKFLETLSEEQREVVLLRVWDDLSYAEISKIMGKSEVNCRMLFSRAIAKIREEGSLALLLLLLIYGK